jgi:hypothetical protein
MRHKFYDTGTCFFDRQVSIPDLALLGGWVSQESFFVFQTHFTPTWLDRQEFRVLKESQFPGT